MNNEKIAEIKNIIAEIGDNRTVIMAPECGSAIEKDRGKKLRIYSYGGRIIDLSTTTNANNDVLKDEKYLNYAGEDKKVAEKYQGNHSYGEFEKDDKSWKECIETCIRVAEKRASGESDTGKVYAERSHETYLIWKNREKTESNAEIIDMEFCTPREWMGSIAKYDGTTVQGQPDLIVFDKESKSFGVIEFKFNNQSVDNMEKHFADYYNIVHSPCEGEIKQEFYRKARYLLDYNISNSIELEELMEACSNPMWFGFLFVGGNKEESRTLFDTAPVDSCIDKKEVGFLYVESLEKNIDYSKKAFFEYLQSISK